MKKIVVVGFCGSMGQRRIENFKHIFANETCQIYGFDVASEEIQNRIATLHNIEITHEHLKDAIYVICTPPDKHIEYVKLALNNNCHVFCEASVVPQDRFHYDEIKALAKKNNLTLFLSNTLRHKDSVRRCREYIFSGTLGKPLFYDYRMGQNLRDWHKNQDIKDYYVSKLETNAVREMMAFELCWLTWLFGDVADIMGSNFLSTSEISRSIGLPDTSIFSLLHSEGTYGNIIIDIVSKLPYRYLRITFDDGNIELDLYNGRFICYNRNGKEVYRHDEEDTSCKSGYSKLSTIVMYEDEVKDFLEHIEERRESSSVEDDFKILKTVERLEELAIV